MPPIPRPLLSLSPREILLGGLALSLALLCVVVLRPFLVPIMWAAILAYVTWPAFLRLRSACGSWPRLAATLMTLLVALLLIAPAILLLFVIHDEILAMVDAVSQLRGTNFELPEALRAIPGLGAWVQQALDRYVLDPEATRHALDDWFGALNTDRTGAAIAVLRNLAKLLLALLTLFYLYRDGSQLHTRVRGLSNRVFGDGIARYLDSAATMVRAVVYGLLASALAQGLLATGGYLIAGAPAPVLLGALTVIAAVVPLFGTVLVWGPVAASMLVAGHAMDAGILVAWGVLIVNPADNIIKLLVISSATEMPILLVLFGVVGGLAAFGLLGVFIGPVALAIATALWRDLAHETSDSSVPPGGNGPHST